MTTTTHPHSTTDPGAPGPHGGRGVPSDGRRTGATWVAATGAFLVLAAAAVFIAGRWDELPDAAKLALVGALTGAFMAVGRGVRRTLPATGDVIFHLGAFLIPVDVAGIAVHTGAGWRQLLLAEAIAGTCALGGLGLATRSVVLQWAGAASVVGLAAGVAAVTEVPAPLALAAAAAVHLARPGRAAVVWAAVAGLAPVAAVAVSGVLAAWSTPGTAVIGTGVLAELGLAGDGQTVMAVASGLLAAVVLGRAARARRDGRLAFLAITSALIGFGTTWATGAVDASLDVLVLPSLFLVIEVVAVATARDDFWGLIGHRVAQAAEVLATLVLPLTAAIVLAMALVDNSGRTAHSTTAAALGILALAWAAADVRRSADGGEPLTLRLLAGPGHGIATLNASVAIVAAVAVGTASTEVTAAVALGLAGLLVLSRRRLGDLVAAGLAVWAPLAVIDTPESAMAAGLIASVIVLEATARRFVEGRESDLVAAGLLLCTAALPLGVACFAAADVIGTTGAALLAVSALWAGALRIETVDLQFSHVPRASMLLALGMLVDQPAQVLLPTAALAAALFVVDALRLDEPLVALGGAVAAQVVVASTAAIAGLDPAATGVAFCVSSVVWGGLATVVDGRWRTPLLASGALALGTGLSLAVHDPRTFALALVVTGGVAMAGAMVLRSWPLGHAGGVVSTVGLVMHLGLEDIAVTELYVTPVALQLLVLGWQLRRESDLSSWVAYGPGLALLGVPALVERWDGGSGWHAVFAGSVAAAAVAAGGWRRLAGPLFIGTGLIVAVTLREALTVAAGIPTSVWLASGGALLLGIAVALERHDTSPVQAGRRVVDLIAENFE